MTLSQVIKLASEHGYIFDNFPYTSLGYEFFTTFNKQPAWLHFNTVAEAARYFQREA